MDITTHRIKDKKNDKIDKWQDLKYELECLWRWSYVYIIEWLLMHRRQYIKIWMGGWNRLKIGIDQGFTTLQKTFGEQ